MSRHLAVFWALSSLAMAWDANDGLETPTEGSSVVQRGFRYVLQYPVTSTPLIIPEAPLRKVLNSPIVDFWSQVLPKEILLPQTLSGLRPMFRWLGLAEFRTKDHLNSDIAEDFLVGAARIDTTIGRGISLSCATCHASNFFGRTIYGLPNKGVRANEAFVLAKQITESLSPEQFQAITRSSNQDKILYAHGREALSYVAAQSPLVLGLDTSLSHVGRSLARRGDDPWARRIPELRKGPRPHPLDILRADSKPSAWWTLKYKTRFLSDGSIRSGHPIATNILWNEIGRGADLEDLFEWFENNPNVPDELLSFIYSLSAPRWEDYFGQKSIDIRRAQAGETLFAENCSKCHGVYEKDWSRGPETLSLSYPRPTLVYDVGTDPGRRKAMRTLSDQLNKLEISKRLGIHSEESPGYVPPPLLGIWARYPYFHNNSVPNLCALLNPNQRPQVFYVGPAENISRDFDVECVGYPVGIKTPAEWVLRPEQRFDTRRQGLSNQGHSKMFLNANGSQRFSAQEQKELLEYLKTL